MKTTDFDFDLPPQFIAQSPAEPRDSSRLMHLDRDSGEIHHLRFRDIARLLRTGDALVMNNTRVIKARLRARKADSGGKAEILLLKRFDDKLWLALIKGRNIRPGSRLQLEGTVLTCSVIERHDRGQALLQFDRAVDDILDELGEVPLPPYIHSRLGQDERYQTVYSEVEGSAAAPTAGLHFTAELLSKIEQRGVKLAYCTLHIGLDTFQPVTAVNVSDHKIHRESIILDQGAATNINDAKRSGGRVIAVGTTSARTLESAAADSSAKSIAKQDVPRIVEHEGLVAAVSDDTDLFITPGYRWRVVDAMITNFHLPRSSLLMMLSAFVGRDALLSAYEIAMAEGYRFYSFGDAMFIT